MGLWQQLCSLSPPGVAITQVWQQRVAWVTWAMLVVRAPTALTNTRRMHARTTIMHCQGSRLALELV